MSPKKIIPVIGLFVAGIMLIALTAAFLSDYQKLELVFHRLEWAYFLFALAASGLAYLSSACSFAVLFGMTAYQVPFPKFFPIMFISDTVNYIVSSAGVSSAANRAFLLKNEKVPYSVSIPLTLAQFTIFNFVLACACLAALGFLHGHPKFAAGPKQEALTAFMGGLVAMVLCMAAFFWAGPFRAWVLGQLRGAGHWVNLYVYKGKKDETRWAASLAEMESTLALLRTAGGRVFLAFLGICSNWCCMAAAFYFCFRSAGLDLPLGLLLVGFTVMFLSSNINPVPAGLGVSESLLAFTFRYLGVDMEATLVAAILYRLVYYLLPLGLATVLYLDILRDILGAPGKEGTA